MFYTDNIHASVTNSMSWSLEGCHFTALLYKYSLLYFLEILWKPVCPAMPDSGEERSGDERQFLLAASYKAAWGETAVGQQPLTAVGQQPLTATLTA